MGTRVEPSGSLGHYLHLKVIVCQIVLVDVSNLELTAGRGRHIFGDIHYRIVVKVQARDGIVGPRVSRFFLYPHGAAFMVEFHHAIALWVLNIIGKH